MRLPRWVPAFIWAGIIFVLISIPGKDIPAADWMQWVSIDKWVHAGVFAVLMILVFHGYEQYDFARPRYYVSVILLLLTVFYGGITELYQHFFLADRYADVYDFTANAIGAIIGMLIYQRYARAFYRRFQN